MGFQPLTNYTGFEHVLNAVPCFVHRNGTLYGVAIEKQSGVRQNLSVYRVRPGATERELVKRYIGGVDSQAQFAAGGCVIHPNGDMEVWASAIPPDVPLVTKTGFQGVWDRIPNIDEAWTSGEAGPQGEKGERGDTGTGITMLQVPRTAPNWSGRTFNGGELVDVPATFGVPIAAAYLVRLGAHAAAADVRFRVGTPTAPYILTANTQVANIEVHIQGFVPGPTIFVSTKNGQATVWLQVCGYTNS